MVFTKKQINPRFFIVLFVLTYFIMLIGGGLLKPGFSHVRQYISELNAITTPHAALIGWVGFIPFGISGLILMVYAAKYIPLSGFGKVGYWLLIAEPIAYIGSAFAPFDVGCPAEGSLSQFIHNALGAVTYLMTTIGLIIISLSPSLAMKWRAFWFAIAIIWFGLFSLMIDPSFGEWRGIIQRLAEWIVYGAIIITAWKFLGKPANQIPK